MATRWNDLELRVLGAHNLESRDTRMASHLIDGVLALDAGGLTRGLTFQEQQKIRAVFLSHRHFDHVRDLPTLGLSVRDTCATIGIYAIQDTADFVVSKLLDGSLYPDFINTPPPRKPVFRLNVMKFYEEIEVLGYKVIAIPMPHTVPAAGFQIRSADSNLFYTGDTGDGMSEALKQVAPDILLTEVTFGNDNEASAMDAGHLTPGLLYKALLDFQCEREYLPRVIVSHVSPAWEDKVRSELRAVSECLGAEILVPHAGIALTL